MKLFVVAAILGACVADRLDNKYLPPRGNSGAGFGPGFNGAGPSPFQPQPGGYNPQQNYGRGASPDANAQILKLNSDITPERFSYEFETSNGIRADAQGVATNGVQEQGSFSYKGDDGQEYSITYTADENGYRPVGAHLPTPPPIPEEILKSLEQNARDEAAGIVDDGTYRGEGAGSSSGYPSGSPSGGAYNRPSGFAPATSRQYLTPNVGPSRPAGSGNFNPQSGYKY